MMRVFRVLYTLLGLCSITFTAPLETSSLPASNTRNPTTEPVAAIATPKPTTASSTTPSTTTLKLTAAPTTTSSTTSAIPTTTQTIPTTTTRPPTTTTTTTTTTTPSTTTSATTTSTTTATTTTSTTKATTTTTSPTTYRESATPSTTFRVIPAVTVITKDKNVIPSLSSEDKNYHEQIKRLKTENERLKIAVGSFAAIIIVAVLFIVVVIYLRRRNNVERRTYDTTGRSPYFRPASIFERKSKNPPIDSEFQYLRNDRLFVNDIHKEMESFKLNQGTEVMTSEL